MAFPGCKPQSDARLEPVDTRGVAFMCDQVHRFLAAAFASALKQLKCSEVENAEGLVASTLNFVICVFFQGLLTSGSQVQPAGIWTFLSGP